LLEKSKMEEFLGKLDKKRKFLVISQFSDTPGHGFSTSEIPWPTLRAFED